MTRNAIRDQIISELRAGHLGFAMKLLEDNNIQPDDKTGAKGGK
jgi:hypothetical protein